MAESKTKHHQFTTILIDSLSTIDIIFRRNGMCTINTPYTAKCINVPLFLSVPFGISFDSMCVHHLDIAQQLCPLFIHHVTQKIDACTNKTPLNIAEPIMHHSSYTDGGIGGVKLWTPIRAFVTPGEHHYYTISWCTTGAKTIYCGKDVSSSFFVCHKRILVEINCDHQYIMWTEDADDPVTARVSRRVEDMTGLSVEYAENVQIANYGLGGHYEPHYDMTTDSNVKNQTHGNRIATVLFYLSKPEFGGATVFDDLGLTLYPSKNDAAFWFNLYRDGQPDWATRHGGCPVFYGTKWVANKWLHEFGQEFRKPCSLDKRERLKLDRN